MSYIVSRSAKFAIKDSIEAAIKAQKAAEEAGEDIEMEEDPVPYITRQHFEEAMKTASRSVSDSELRRYESYAAQIQSSRGTFNFRFSENAGNNGNTEQPALGGDGDDDDLYN